MGKKPFKRPPSHAETRKKTYEKLEMRVRERTAELSRINKALRENEERYRRVLAALVEGVVVIDAKGTILSANPGAEKILGFKASELAGRSIFDPRWAVMHEDSKLQEPEDFFIARSLRTGQSFANVVVGLKHADGRVVWLNGNTQPLIRPGEQKPYAVVASFFDITPSKQMEAEIHTLNTELEHKVEKRTSELQTTASELEAFSYSVSHDLRAPLRAIEGFSGILLEDHAGQLNDEGKRLLQVVRKNTLIMAQLIDDLLSFSRIARKDLAKKRVPMADLAKLVAEDLRDAAHATDAQLKVGRLPDACGDAPLLRQVWVNLLSNAFKFSRNSKPIQIDIRAENRGEETIYSVRDNGVGFDMDYAGKLFGVFQRLHSVQEFEGTGVGLAIVQRIIAKHGGRVWAEGRPHGGAAFYFALPRLETP